ncbi:MAG: ankyrin repeat domain-containing protein [bacterium]|nr:ankyrin repeat domain-containing protein [bacterium]
MTDTPFTPDELNNAMLRAAREGDLLVFEEALDSGARADFRDPATGRSVYFTLIDQLDNDGGAAPRDGVHLIMIMSLINKGVDVNLRDNDGISPLNYTLQKENFTAATILLASKADANEHFPPNGDTPLHLAVRLALAGQGVRLLDNLLMMKADPTVKNNAGVSSLDLLGQFAAGPDDLATVRDKLAGSSHAMGAMAEHRDAQQDYLRRQAKRGGLKL